MEKDQFHRVLVPFALRADIIRGAKVTSCSPSMRNKFSNEHLEYDCLVSPSADIAWFLFPW